MKRTSKSDWARIRSMKDRDIDFSDIPELNEDFFNEAILWPGKKKQITIRLDPDVVNFYKKDGPGYQSRINKILRRYMEIYYRQEKNA
jgi:uncharacterized protein (DUF4415 family)